MKILLRLFIKQTQNQTLEEFKINLEKYLFLSVGKASVESHVKQQFSRDFIIMGEGI